MASSEQLSKNNQNAQVWANWDTNTERDFKHCIAEVVALLPTLYPDYQFTYKTKVNNQALIESFKSYSPEHEPALNGSKHGGSQPDGGVIYVQCTAGAMPVFIGENKHQQDNPGNALERSLKNISFFKNLLIAEDYFPYLLNINGPIVNDQKGNLFDRITQDAGFAQVNSVHVKSDPKTPRLRPFTIVLDAEFNYNRIKDISLAIIGESIDYLKGVGKL